MAQALPEGDPLRGRAREAAARLDLPIQDKTMAGRIAAFFKEPRA